MMTLKQRLLHLTEIYCGARGMSEARLATIIFDQGGTYKRLRLGGDMTTHKWEEAMQWFNDHWPDEQPWPAEIPRPIITTPPRGDTT